MTCALVPVSFTSDVITDGVTHEDDSIGNDAWREAVAIVQTSFIAISHPTGLRCIISEEHCLLQRTRAKGLVGGSMRRQVGSRSWAD